MSCEGRIEGAVVFDQSNSFHWSAEPGTQTKFILSTSPALCWHSLTLAVLAMEKLNIELNSERFVKILEKLIGETEHLQNNPPKFIPQEDK